MPAAIAQLPAQGDALGDPGLGRVEVAPAVGVRAQPVEDRRPGLVVARRLGHRETLAQVRLAEGVVALVAREEPGTAERLAAVLRGRVVADREGRREPQPAFRVVAARPPELGERARAAGARTTRRPPASPTPAPRGCRCARCRAGRAPRARGPSGSRAPPPRPGRAPRTRGPSASRPPRRSRASRSRASARTVESIEVLAARRVRPEERRLGQLAQPIDDVDAQRLEAAPFAALEDRRRGRRCERARDHRDPAVEPQRTGSGSRPEAPVHRRTEAPLARRGGPLLDSASDRPSLPGSATRSASWSSSWCGASTRSAAAASSIASGMPSRRRQIEATRARLASVGSSSGRAASARSRNRAAAGLSRSDVLVVLVLRGDRERLDPHDVLARDPEREAARGEDREPGRARLEVRERRRGRADVLDGVEDEQRGSSPERRRQRVGQGLAGLVGDADRARDRGQHERRSLTPSSGTNAMRPRQAARSRVASSAASLLFPTPPTPTSVRNGDRRSRVRRRSSSSSVSRPTSDVSGALGRRRRPARHDLASGAGRSDPRRAGAEDGAEGSGVAGSAVGCIKIGSIRRAGELHASGHRSQPRVCSRHIVRANSLDRAAG